MIMGLQGSNADATHLAGKKKYKAKLDKFCIYTVTMQGLQNFLLLKVQKTWMLKLLDTRT